MPFLDELPEGANNPPPDLPFVLPSAAPLALLDTLLLGCLAGNGLLALLPPGVLVADVLTNSCSVETNLLFLGLTLESPPVILGFSTKAREVDAVEDEGIMI